MKRKAARLSSSEWISKKLELLVDASEGVTADENVHYPGHAWSIVKLLLLSGWIYVYTTIIPKYFENYRYIDLLAGSGTTYVKETRDVIIGSSLIAHFFARNPFTGYVCIEKRHDRCRSLSERAARMMGNEARILEGDCNELVPEIISEEERTHNLVFIDNEGFDAVWDTVQAVVGANSDTLIVFPTSSIMRVAKTKRTWTCLDRFYGGRSWFDAQDEEECLEIYLQQLKDCFGNLRRKESYVSNVRVGSGQFYYDVILVCKRGPYVQAWDYLRKRLDWTDPKTIEIALDILKGRATQMDWFLGLDDKISSIRRGRREDEKGATLENFL